MSDGSSIGYENSSWGQALYFK